VGEAGIGKSRLADELAAGVSAAVPILRGQTRALTDTATFSPAAAIIGDLAGVKPNDAPHVVRERLRALAERTGGPGAANRTAKRLALLFGQADGEDEAAFVPEVHAGFISVIDGLSRDHPVMVMFEDAHTLKPPMLDLIERLGTRGEGPRRALVLALARDELLAQRPTWGSTSGSSVLIRLETLSRDESVQLARQAGGGHIGDAEAIEIAERAGGNPYFIIETTGMLMPSAGGQDGHTPRTVPPTVQAVIGARLDALPPRLRDLARRASTFKYGFGLPDLRFVDPDATLEEVKQLEDAEVLVPEMEQSEPERWRVRHATLKDVIYASLPKRERERLHQLLAQNLLNTGHPSLAADHLELAALAAIDLDPNNRTLPDQAANALLVAGDRARRRMESRTAIDRYQRGLNMSGPQERWAAREARMLAGMGEAHYWLGEYATASQVLNRAVALGERNQDPFTLALALRFLGDIAINFEADVDRAERLLNRSVLAAEQLGDPWAIVRSLLFAGWVPWTRGQYKEAEEIWTRALSLVDPKDHWARVRGLTALSVNKSDMQDFDAALEHIEEASRLAEDTGDRFIVANTLVQKARVLDDLGRAAEAMPCFDRGVAIFGELGARWEMADARAARGIAYRNLGRLDQAEEDLRFAIRTAEELGDRQIPPWTWRHLAVVAELRGDNATAAEWLKRAKDAASRGPR
jgi:tetratricopeptide (TPR) repeat protein